MPRLRKQSRADAGVRQAPSGQVELFKESRFCAGAHKSLLRERCLEHYVCTMRGAAATDKRTEDRAERQARIEKAAEHVFAHRGVTAATMDDIARHSGVSKGALYLHFESKEQLYLTLAVRALKELISKLEANPTDGSGFQRTRALIETYAHYSLSDPARFCLAGAWVAPDWQLPKSEALATCYVELVRNALRLAVEVFELGKRDGSIPAHLDTQLTILQFLGGMHGVLALRAKILESPEEAPPQLDRQLWAGLVKQHDGLEPAAIDRERIVTSYVELLLSAIEQK
jgi:AcrR family transcriptional regulator